MCRSSIYQTVSWSLHTSIGLNVKIGDIFLFNVVYRHGTMLLHILENQKDTIWKQEGHKMRNNYIYCHVTLWFPTYMIHFFGIPSLLSLRKSNRPNVALLYLRLLSICPIIVFYLRTFNLTGCTISQQL